MTKIQSAGGMDVLLAQQMATGALGASQANNLKDRKLSSEAEIEKAASGFEALLLHEMIKSMWSTVEESSLLGESSNEGQIYRDMLNQAIADSIADGKGIGVKDFLQKELSRIENASKEKERG